MFLPTDQTLGSQLLGSFVLWKMASPIPCELGFPLRLVLDERSRAMTFIGLEPSHHWCVWPQRSRHLSGRDDDGPTYVCQCTHQDKVTQETPQQIPEEYADSSCSCAITVHQKYLPHIRETTGYCNKLMLHFS